MSVQRFLALGLALLLSGSPVLQQIQGYRSNPNPALILHAAMNEEQCFTAIEAFAERNFSIPDDFPLSKREHDESGNFTLIWVRPKGRNASMGGNIRLMIDAQGNLISYDAINIDSPALEPIWSNFVRLHDRQILEREAFKHVQFFCPNSVAELSATALVSDFSHSYDTSFFFPRLLNGIPIEGQGIRVFLDPITLQITHFERTWNPAPLHANSPEEALTPEQMITMLTEDLRLCYWNPYHIATNGQTQLIYTTVSGDDAYLATTGQSYWENFLEKYAELNGFWNSRPWSEFGLLHNNPLPWLAIEQLGSGALSSEQAEQKLRNTSGIDFPEDAELISSTCFGTGDTAVWQLTWKCPEVSDTEITTFVDAFTGRVLAYEYGWSTSEHYGFADDPQRLQENDLLAKATAFAQAHFPEEFAFCQPNPVKKQGDLLLPLQPEARRYSAGFTWYRLLDGVVCPDNGISVSIDSVSGKIVAFGSTWWGTDCFQKNQISLDVQQARQRFLSETTLKLAYRIDSGDQRAVLIYLCDPLRLNATSGIWLESSGEQSLSAKGAFFTDLIGHPDETKVAALARLEIIPVSERVFDPSRQMTQEAYFYELASLSSNQPISRITSWDLRIIVESHFDDITLYQPEAIISKGDALFYLLRQAGYANAADLKPEVYIDFPGVPKNLRGYVAIGRSLGLIDTAWNWSDPLTRLDAALLFYKVVTR